MEQNNHITHASNASSSRQHCSVSVVVSTRNRGSKLRYLLRSLLECETAPDSQWEIIVADNNSTDETAQVMHEFLAQHPGRGRYVYQSTPAKATGLNLAIRHARGDIIALTDDDARVDRTWLLELVRAYRADPEIAGIGGRVELFDPAAAPVAIRRSREPRVISDRPFDPRSIPVIGCNLSFRRAVLDAVGAYDERFGPGSAIGSGDDVDMLYRVQRAGYKLTYAPQLLVYHDHGRRIGEDERPTVRRYMRGRGGFYLKYLRLGDRHIMRCAYRELRGAAVSLLSGCLQGKLDRSTLRELSAMTSGAIAYVRAPKRQQNEPALVRVMPPPDEPKGNPARS